MNLYLL